MQELHSVEHPLAVDSGNIQLSGYRRPGGDEYRGEAILLELPEPLPVPDALAVADLDVGMIQDQLCLFEQHLLIEAVAGNGAVQGASGFRLPFKDRYPVTGCGQIQGRGQAGRSGSHHGHPLSVLGRPGGGLALFSLAIARFPPLCGRTELRVGVLAFAQRVVCDITQDAVRRLAQRVVCDKTLQVVDGHRLIHLGPIAGTLAGVVADTPAHRRQGMALPDQLVGLSILPGRDQGDVALDVYMGRAGLPAGGNTRLLYGEEVRDGLGIATIDRLAFYEAFVVLAEHAHRTDFGTVAAAVALKLVHEAGLLLELQMKGPGLAVDTGELGVGVQLDVGMTTGVHQLRGHDAHGAVIGGKGLVQLGHDPADGGLVVDQVNFESHLPQVQGGLHPGDAGAQHGYRSYLLLRRCFRMCFHWSFRPWAGGFAHIKLSIME